MKCLMAMIDRKYRKNAASSLGRRWRRSITPPRAHALCRRGRMGQAPPRKRDNALMPIEERFAASLKSSGRTYRRSK